MNCRMVLSLAVALALSLISAGLAWRLAHPAPPVIFQLQPKK